MGVKSIGVPESCWVVEVGLGKECPALLVLIESLHAAPPVFKTELKPMTLYVRPQKILPGRVTSKPANGIHFVLPHKARPESGMDHLTTQQETGICSLESKATLKERSRIPSKYPFIRATSAILYESYKQWLGAHDSRKAFSDSIQ